VGDETRNNRNREKEILFMDLRQLGEPFEKKYTQFSEDDIKKVTDTYHQWQTATMVNDKLLVVNEGENINHSSLTINHYKDIPEYCYSAPFDEVVKKDFSLVPSKYIAFINRDENIDFDEKMQSLKSEFAELLKAEEQSKKDLLDVFKTLGYEIG
jgi:type I restriction enzyme M protein